MSYHKMAKAVGAMCRTMYGRDGLLSKAFYIKGSQTFRQFLQFDVTAKKKMKDLVCLACADGMLYYVIITDQITFTSLCFQLL